MHFYFDAFLKIIEFAATAHHKLDLIIFLKMPNINQYIFKDFKKFTS